MEKDKEVFPSIEPSEMPAFLNDIASEYFKDNQEIMLKLAQCSMHIHVLNKLLNIK